jgi:hypothetical protein
MNGRMVARHAGGVKCVLVSAWGAGADVDAGADSWYDVSYPYDVIMD